MRSDGSGLPCRSVSLLVRDDGLKKVDNLLLSSGHDVELPARLGEAVVDVRAEVDEVLSQGIETRCGGPAEVTNFAPELTDIAVGSTCENSSGRRVLFAYPHPAGQVVHLLLEGADT